LLPMLLQFYQSIPISIATGPKGYFDQFKMPEVKRKIFGFW
jgi:hypothetical protein